jgi:hypothetical protein
MWVRLGRPAIILFRTFDGDRPGAGFGLDKPAGSGEGFDATSQPDRRASTRRKGTSQVTWYQREATHYGADPNYGLGLLPGRSHGL